MILARLKATGAGSLNVEGGRERANWTVVSKWSYTQSGTYTVFVASCCVVTQRMYNSNIIPASTPPTQKKRRKKKQKGKNCEINYKNLYIHIIYAYEMHIYIHRMLYIYTNFIYTFTFHTPMLILLVVQVTKRCPLENDYQGEIYLFFFLPGL